MPSQHGVALVNLDLVRSGPVKLGVEITGLGIGVGPRVLPSVSWCLRVGAAHRISLTETPTSGKSAKSPSAVIAGTSKRAASARHARSPKDSPWLFERGRRSAASMPS